MKLYPNFLKKVILPIAEKLLNFPFISILNNWIHLEKFDSEQIKAYQQNQLNKLLLHAIKTVPGYSKLSVKSILQDFPVATKAMYRKNEDLWISSRFKKDDLLIEKSSGSSGVQGKVYMSHVESMRA